MVSNPLFMIPDFFLRFPNGYTLGLKVAIAEFIGKISGIMKSGLEAMPLFLLDELLKYFVKFWLILRNL